MIDNYADCMYNKAMMLQKMYGATPVAKYSLADCTQAPAKACKPCDENKKEAIPMSSFSTAIVNTSDSIEAKQRRSLSSALHNAFHDKIDAAEKQFNINAGTAPGTVAEFIQRIKDGKFSIKPDQEDQYAGSFWYVIDWKDPSVTVDKDGYKAARAALETEYHALELRIGIIPVADALAAVEAYRDGTAAAATSPKA